MVSVLWDRHAPSISFPGGTSANALPAERCVKEAPFILVGAFSFKRTPTRKSPGREVSAQPGRVLVPEIGKCGLCGLRFPPVN